MPTSMRLLGVHGKNAPTKKSKTVVPADFSIAGIIGKFERSYLKAFQVFNPTEEKEIFGDAINSAQYGKDTTKLFWDNLAGVNGSLFIKSHVGYNGSVIDGVVASGTLTDENGLASVLAVVNEMRTKYLAHIADATEHTTDADTVNTISSPLASDLSTAIALVNEMITRYTAHELDSSLASLWLYHAGQRTGTHALSSSTPVTNLADLITMVADFKTKYNAHDADTSAHGTDTSHQLTLTASSTPASTLKIESAYKTELDYGTSGNRTGVKIETGLRFITAVKTTIATSDTSAILDSVSGIKVGDLIVFSATGGTAAEVIKKVVSIDESLGKVSWSGVFSASAQGQIGDKLSVPGFRIHTYRKSIDGIETEVETDLGQVWCTMEPEVTSYYVQNIHAENRWIKVTDLASSSTTLESFPNAGSSATYLTSGAAGTSPSTSAHWAIDLVAMDNLPIRMLCNPETSDVTINKAGETYCKGRTDSPFWIATIAENQTKSQLITIGTNYQRSDDVFQVNVADWLEVDDPYNSSANAPDRIVPNVGFVMGAWIRSIANLGVHYIPSVDTIAGVGFNGIYNTNLGNLSDQDRTQLAEYGINIIQNISGSGYRIRNFFTPSISQDFQFANGLLMRNYIKLSSEQSLLSSENYPNSFNRIKEDRAAILAFLYKLWDRGSTGSVPAGETFGQTENLDGTLTKPTDHFEVEADAINNPLSSINAGERNLSVYFTFPTPTSSIEIQVGILLR